MQLYIHTHICFHIKFLQVSYLNYAHLCTGKLIGEMLCYIQILVCYLAYQIEEKYLPMSTLTSNSMHLEWICKFKEPLLGPLH